MKLQFARIPGVHILKTFGPESADIEAIVYNSSAARKGSAFFCVIGENTDGHLYIEPAIENGAQAIIGSNEEILAQQAKHHPTISFVLVADVRNASSICLDPHLRPLSRDVMSIAACGGQLSLARPSTSGTKRTGRSSS